MVEGETRFISTEDMLTDARLDNIRWENKYTPCSRRRANAVARRHYGSEEVCRRCPTGQPLETFEEGAVDSRSTKSVNFLIICFNYVHETLMMRVVLVGSRLPRTSACVSSQMKKIGGSPPEIEEALRPMPPIRRPPF